MKESSEEHLGRPVTRTRGEARGKRGAKGIWEPETKARSDDDIEAKKQSDKSQYNR
jgi:hypothetical protein